jgi:hypothetical protein
MSAPTLIEAGCGAGGVPSPYAQPVPFVEHSHHLSEIRTPLRGLYLASMSQVYPWDRGTNYAVEIGRRTVRMMMDDGTL